MSIVYNNAITYKNVLPLLTVSPNKELKCPTLYDNAITK